MSDVAKPILVFDGKCGFCRIWIDYWKRLTEDAIDYEPFQKVADRYPQVPAENFKRAVHLIEPNGDVFSGANAVFRTLAYKSTRRWPLWLYQHMAGFAAVTEWAYRLIARNRGLFYWLTVIPFGRELRPRHYQLVEWLFRKCLAVIWLIAFLSFGVQSSGLIGSQGILPVNLYLSRAQQFLGHQAWLAVPTFFWLNSSDAAIQAVWIAGVICALLALFGIVWRGALFVAFLLYLSLFNASQEFLSYQWDILLLETGFLTIFLGYAHAIVWLFRWLLFRLMFLSGAVKLLSGDPVWRSLDALLVHYQTQPIPTPLAWYAHQLPVWFQKVSCGAVFLIELLVPFLVLGPRRCRMFAAPWLIGLQCLIVLTGNYAFFNLLALSLCLFLFDDDVVRRMMPDSWTAIMMREERRWVPLRVRRSVTWALGILIVVLSGSLFMQTLTGRLPAITRSLVSFAAPFGISSSYGLFATMTTKRPEIVIEGSSDGSNWVEYDFKYKPGRLDRRPPWVAPHQPRLDWQMWFAALGSYRENAWFINAIARLLQGTPEVLALLRGNPFPDRPPRFIRARLYEYQFTDWNTRANTGNWWTRTPAGLYVPSVTLDDLRAMELATPWRLPVVAGLTTLHQEQVHGMRE